MKKILVACLFLFLGLAVKSQYGAELMIGARINYVGGGRIVTWDGKRVNLGYTIQGIVSPGYFVCNNLALGVNLGYEYMKDEEGHQYTLQTIPFLRYYTPHGALRFFAQLESGYGWGESFLRNGHDGSHTLWISTLKPGLFIRVKDYMAVEVTVMSLEYKEINMKDQISHQRTFTSKWKYNWLDISFGVSFLIGL